MNPFRSKFWRILNRNVVLINKVLDCVFSWYLSKLAYTSRKACYWISHENFNEFHKLLSILLGAIKDKGIFVLSLTVSKLIVDFAFNYHILHWQFWEGIVNNDVKIKAYLSLFLWKFISKFWKLFQTSFIIHVVFQGFKISQKKTSKNILSF